MQTAANSIKRHSGAAFRVRHELALAVAAAAVVTVVVGATWLLTLAWLSARARVVTPGPAAADEALALAAATVAVAIAAWLCLGVALELLALAPGTVGRAADRWAERLTPALARRVAAFVLGVGVGVAGGPSTAVAGARTAVGTVAHGSDSAPAAPADPGFGALATSPRSVGAAPDPGFAPALAAPGFAPTPRFVPTPDVTPTPEGPGFTPTAPRVRPQVDAGLLGSRSRSTTDAEVVVHRGDTLWSIAAHHLGPEAGDAEIARAWPRWYAANRDRIGDDPDLLLPGQILRVPAPDPTGSVTR